jgi:hypothetical protein
MAITIKTVPLINDDEIFVSPDAANEDWLRARRLLKAAKAGDEEAKRKLQEMEDESMIIVEETE